MYTVSRLPVHSHHRDRPAFILVRMQEKQAIYDAALDPNSGWPEQPLRSPPKRCDGPPMTMTHGSSNRHIGRCTASQ